MIGQKDGRMAKLKYPEELQEFCKSLEIPIPDLPGWTAVSKGRTPQVEERWLLVPKRKDQHEEEKK